MEPELEQPPTVDEVLDDIMDLVNAAYDYLTVTWRPQAASKALWGAIGIAEDFWSTQDDEGKGREQGKGDGPQPAGHVAFDDEEAKRDA